MNSFRLLVTTFIALSIANTTLAITDPEPNPFDNLEEGEQIFEATVSNVTEEILTVENSGNQEFSGNFDQIFKYRDGAGPAAANEFFVGDRVRIMTDANKVIRAAQNYELLLCDQNFYGWVKDPTETSFTLKTIRQKEYEVLAGEATQYREEDGNQLFGYSPRPDDIVRIHGVVNTNVKKIFTETFGAYVSLLSEETITPLVEAFEAEKIGTPLEQQFDDVDSEHEFFYAINFLKLENIVNGYDDGTYKADDPINRAEFTKIIIGSKFKDDIPTELSENCFSDFEKSSWFAPYVCLAKEKIIINGYPDATFRPANQVNLAEATKILLNTFDIETEELKEGEEWFIPFINKATELKILPENFAEPAAKITRGQMAELTMRAIKYNKGELEEYLSESI